MLAPAIPPPTMTTRARSGNMLVVPPRATSHELRLPSSRGSRSRAARPAGASFALKRLPSQAHQGDAFAWNGLQAHRKRRLARLDQVLRQGAGTAALTAQPGLRVVQVEKR